MNINRLLNAACDCVTRFRSSHFPLKTVANDVIRAKKLNSTERKALLDLVFAWSREIYLIEDFLSQKIRFFKGTSRQAQDKAALELLAHEFFPNNRAMALEYENYKKLTPDKNIKALAFVGEKLLKDYGDMANQIAEGLFKKPKIYLAVKSLDVLAELKKLGINAQKHPIFERALAVDQINIKELPKDLSSKLWLMDVGSQIIADSLKVSAGDDVLDMCAGEGGKALFISQNDCHLVAMDIDEARLKVARSRLTNKAEYICADATSYDFKDKKFDWILLDAPCSGTGVIKRNPDLIHRLDQKDVSKYIEIQSKLLDKAVQWLKPSGKLIYATCSLFKSENEEQIERILKKNKDIKPYSLKKLLGEQLVDSDSVSSLTLFPHVQDCDGFFIAALCKNSA